MSRRITLSELEEKINCFKEVYDSIRLVDPVQKKVLELNNLKTVETSEVCYKYWEEEEICNNCISIRAYQENKSFMKFEHKAGVCMLVTSFPIEDCERPVVLELFKNTTDILVLDEEGYSNGRSMNTVLEDINKLVIEDHLTEAYNRRFVDERLSSELIQANISDKPLSVIFIDVNNMKTINDTYGHQVGDMALKHVVKNIKSCINKDIDWVARYGGDEFIVSLRGRDKSYAHQVAERIVYQIQNSEMDLEEEIKISISFGIHTMENSLVNAEDMIRIADMEMYQMKLNCKEQRKEE